MSTKRSHILKQTCSWKLQVCLSMCDPLVDSRHWRVKKIVLDMEINVQGQQLGECLQYCGSLWASPSCLCSLLHWLLPSLNPLHWNMKALVAKRYYVSAETYSTLHKKRNLLLSKYDQICSFLQIRSHFMKNLPN